MTRSHDVQVVSRRPEGIGQQVDQMSAGLISQTAP
jgi:hypothetical protein